MKMQDGDVKTPITRKVIQVGSSRAISLPKSWLDYLEAEHGYKIEKVAIEVNGNLKITPILRKENEGRVVG